MSFIVNPYVYAAQVDPDCAAFLTATGITDPTISGAICTLVTSLKAQGIWAKMDAIYPFVGGTATTHMYNLKNPANTNAAFRLSFTGGWTHNSNGITGNGLNATANTFVNNLMLSINSCHISTYSRTNVEQSSVDIGSGGFSSGLHHGLRFTGIGAFMRTYLSGTPSVANLNSQGLYVSTRTASNLSKMYKNGSTIITSSLSSVSQNSENIFIGAYQGGSFFSTRNMSFTTIGSGLTDSDAASMYTIVQTFQTTLGRQV
jgi:hypothetical protein